MKVVTGSEMQRLDRRAIEEFQIPSLVLMERAGDRCADVVRELFGTMGRAAVIAGKGNNGGDGFVIARLLEASGWDVSTFVLAMPDEIAGDAAVNLQRLNPARLFFCPVSELLREHVTQIHGATVIIDALFGTGLKKNLQGSFADAVEMINSSPAPVVAVDIPSGIDAATGRVLGVAVKAEVTVTFALAKCGHVLSPGAEYAGEVRVVDIGIPSEVAEEADAFDYIDRAYVKQKLRCRERVSHKGSFGHALILAGSTGKSGAAAMAANSCVRAGAGLTTVAVPNSIHPIMEIKTTEAMTVPLPDSAEGSLLPEAFHVFRQLSEGKNVLAVGPGIGVKSGAVQLVRQIVADSSLPLVIDADGLNAIAEDTSILLRKRSSTVILTPHPGEMSRLSGLTAGEIEEDRVAAARKFAVEHNVFVILKGAGTVIAAPDRSVAINGSGNPGMASGGMGDVLTGIVTALLAQGYPAVDACRLGVFLHGHSADLVAGEKGEVGITAVDVQEQFPYACKDIMESADPAGEVMKKKTHSGGSRARSIKYVDRS